MSIAGGTPQSEMGDLGVTGSTRGDIPEQEYRSGRGSAGTPGQGQQPRDASGGRVDADDEDTEPAI